MFKQKKLNIIPGLQLPNNNTESIRESDVGDRVQIPMQDSSNTRKSISPISYNNNNTNPTKSQIASLPSVYNMLQNSENNTNKQNTRLFIANNQNINYNIREGDISGERRIPFISGRNDGRRVSERNGIQAVEYGDEIEKRQTRKFTIDEYKNFERQIQSTAKTVLTKEEIEIKSNVKKFWYSNNHCYIIHSFTKFLFKI